MTRIAVLAALAALTGCRSAAPAPSPPPAAGEAQAVAEAFTGVLGALLPPAATTLHVVVDGAAPREALYAALADKGYGLSPAPLPGAVSARLGAQAHDDLIVLRVELGDGRGNPATAASTAVHRGPPPVWKAPVLVTGDRPR